MKEYVKANDKYLELAIGNSAWRILFIYIAMGVTMLGIHERKGTKKIYTT